jgi:hypothetical protein
MSKTNQPNTEKPAVSANLFCFLREKPAAKLENVRHSSYQIETKI